MSFDQVLARLRGDVKEAKQQHLGVTKVLTKDVAELLCDYDRLNAAVRLMYPPHLEMMTKAAEEMQSALNLARPRK